MFQRDAFKPLIELIAKDESHLALLDGGDSLDLMVRVEVGLAWLSSLRPGTSQ